VHGSTSGMGAFIVFTDKIWVLDSGASTHMLGIKEKIHFLF